MSKSPDILPFSSSASGLMRQLKLALREVEQRDTQIGDLIQVVNKAVRDAAETKTSVAAREARLQALSEQVREFETIKREWREFRNENERIQGELAKSRLRGAELRLEVDQLRASRQNMAKEILSLQEVITELQVALRNKQVVIDERDQEVEGPDANDEAGVRPAPARALVAQDEAREEYPLDEASIVIGRASDCDIRIGCAQASRRHARLVNGEAGTTIEDLGSMNGVRVNDVKVSSQRLRDGDIVRIGRSLFKFRWSASPNPS